MHRSKEPPTLDRKGDSEKNDYLEFMALGSGQEVGR